jgi:hypothetical protein
MSLRFHEAGMSASTLESRVTILEQQVAELRAAGTAANGRDWRRTVGMFAGDEVMKEILDEARKYREADRRKARRRYARIRAGKAKK